MRLKFGSSGLGKHTHPIGITGSMAMQTIFLVRVDFWFPNKIGFLRKPRKLSFIELEPKPRVRRLYSTEDVCFKTKIWYFDSQKRRQHHRTKMVGHNLFQHVQKKVSQPLQKSVCITRYLTNAAKL